MAKFSTKPWWQVGYTMFPSKPCWFKREFFNVSSRSRVWWISSFLSHDQFMSICKTLPETNIIPENWPSQRKLVFQPSMFRRELLLVHQKVIHHLAKGQWYPWHHLKCLESTAELLISPESCHSIFMVGSGWPDEIYKQRQQNPWRTFREILIGL